MLPKMDVEKKTQANAPTPAMMIKAYAKDKLTKMSSEKLLDSLFQGGQIFLSRYQILSEIENRVKKGDKYFSQEKNIVRLVDGLAQEKDPLVAQLYVSILNKTAKGTPFIQNMLKRKAPELYSFILNKKGKDIKEGLAISPLTNEEIIGVMYMLSVFKGDEKKVMALIDEYNITYGQRYSPEILTSMYNGILGKHDETRPLCVVVMTKTDWNGAFYQNRKTFDHLAETHNVVVVEVETEDDFYKKTDEVAKKHGKINLLIIGGHGNPDSIALGKGKNEKEHIDSADIVQDKKEWIKLRENMAVGGSVVLISCSTAKGKEPIASKISKALNKTVIAPEKDSSLDSIDVKPILGEKLVSYTVTYKADKTPFAGSVFIWGIGMENFIDYLIAKLAGKTIIKSIPKKEKT